MLLAIETSCDETAIAVIDLAKFIGGAGAAEFLRADLISSQAKLHQPYGGVVPELAAREHIANLPLLFQEALHQAEISVAELTALAVTQGPGLKGSLLAGVSFAKAFALGAGLPLLALNHLEGHLFAGELLRPSERPEYPLLALLVSGGHTMLISSESFRNYQIVAQTRDDAAGEAFDKIASLLDLGYPGGPALSRAAESGNAGAFRFPLALPADQTSFSFSGLKTAVMKTVKSLGEKVSEPQVKSDLALAAEQAIVGSLVKKCAAACDALKPRSVLLTGGVAANRVLREALRGEASARGMKFVVPPPRWCTDNAAMIGVLAARIMESDYSAYSAWQPNDQLSPAGQMIRLGPQTASGFGARPRWPLAELYQSDTEQAGANADQTTRIGDLL